MSTLTIQLKDRTYMKVDVNLLVFRAELTHNGHGCREDLYVKGFRDGLLAADFKVDSIDNIKIENVYNGPG